MAAFEDLEAVELLLILGAVGAAIYYIIIGSKALSDVAKPWLNKVSQVPGAIGDISQSVFNPNKLTTYGQKIYDNVVVPGTGLTVSDLRSAGYTDDQINQLWAQGRQAGLPIDTPVQPSTGDPTLDSINVDYTGIGIGG